MKILQLVFLSALMLLARSAFASEDVRTAKFRALEEAWTAAIKSQDRASLEPFLRPEYSLTVARAGKPLGFTDRAEWLRNATTTYVIHEFQFHEIVVREYGDTAVVSSRYTQKATVNGRSRESEAFLTDIWVKTGSAWQVSARYSSQLNPAPAAPASAPPATKTGSEPS
jgi:ketosteroid isomerase-like protein